MFDVRTQETIFQGKLNAIKYQFLPISAARVAIITLVKSGYRGHIFSGIPVTQ